MKEKVSMSVTYFLFFFAANKMKKRDEEDLNGKKVKTNLNVYYLSETETPGSLVQIKCNRNGDLFFLSLSHKFPLLNNTNKTFLFLLIAVSDSNKQLKNKIKRNIIKTNSHQIKTTTYRSLRENSKGTKTTKEKS